MAIESTAVFALRAWPSRGYFTPREQNVLTDPLVDAKNVKKGQHFNLMSKLLKKTRKRVKKKETGITCILTCICF